MNVDEERWGDEGAKRREKRGSNAGKWTKGGSTRARRVGEDVKFETFSSNASLAIRLTCIDPPSPASSHESLTNAWELYGHRSIIDDDLLQLYESNFRVVPLSSLLFSLHSNRIYLFIGGEARVKPWLNLVRPRLRCLRYFRNYVAIVHWNIRFSRLGMHALCYRDQASFRVILGVIGNDAFVIISWGRYLLITGFELDSWCGYLGNKNKNINGNFFWKCSLQLQSREWVRIILTD